MELATDMWSSPAALILCKRRRWGPSMCNDDPTDDPTDDPQVGGESRFRFRQDYFSSRFSGTWFADKTEGWFHG
jgi:hypothetical protein